ncbi:MAG: acetylornithine/succinylornithine family transaminase, partial [Clostridia bacterium]|nr:acetylornithine/succinylornithine family transaminase [Clostridia bacterium]
ADGFAGEGKAYIDFGSGIAVNTLGHDAGWADAVCAQVKRLAHTSNYFYTEPQSQLAETLCQKTGLRRVFFSNSGAEANECAIKAARKYSHDKYGDGRNVILTLENSFHGRTVTTLSATGQDVFHTDFMPFTPGFCHIPANDVAALEGALTDDVCALMMEPVQGEGGVIVLDADYLAAAQKLCADRDVLVILDEVQTGNGRTGTLYAFEQLGITPDILSTAKGLAGGLPLGATLFGEKVENTLGKGKHGSTFGGNPVCCAGANYVLSRLDDAFLTEVRAKADYFREKLTAMPNVAGVSGLGLMIGISLKAGDAHEIAVRCLEKGLIVLTAKDKVRLLPPLNISYADIDRGLAILAEVMA